jgi:hypothetical protein
MTHPRRAALLLLPWLALACDGNGEPHPCDAGTPTCESSLVVTIPTNSVDFTITIDDGQGLDATIECPTPDGGHQITGYTITCGASQVTIETSSSFGDTVEVQLEQGVPETFTPDYQKGGDFCGNPCTIGTIDL